MKSKKITVNNTGVVVYSDGSITKPFHGRVKQTFGYKNRKGYMSTSISCKTLYMHRIVAQAFLPDFLDYPSVDHIDGNKANNDVSNLRMATHRFQRMAYLTKTKGCSSQYRGVCWNKHSGKWHARCEINGKMTHIGSFCDEREAAIARDACAIAQGFPLEGLNFPKN